MVRNIIMLLQEPLISLVLLILCLFALLDSFKRYKKGDKQYKFVSFGFILLILSGIMQKIFFRLHIFPRTILGISFSLIIFLLVFMSVIFIFYIPHKLSKKK